MERLSILIVFCVVPALSALAGNETDKLALLDFKAKLTDGPLGLLSSWNESTHFCAWPGVTCSRRHVARVGELNVQSWRLTGHLSPHVGNLSFLRMLNLGNNTFLSEIPPEIGRLFRLRSLFLQNNSFSGEIPANISRCISLEYLTLFGNDLVGEIPGSIGNLSSLHSVYLRGNNLRGSIPQSLGKMKSLRLLVLGDNNFTGTIPISLFNVSTMEHFSVINNKLEGSLPPYLGHTLPNLRYFFFDGNNFSGPIPVSISNASNLVLFQINYNSFTGKVPSFARSSNLLTLGLVDNNLGYADTDDLNFIHDLINCTQLQNLLISSNNLGGKIAESLSNMTSLTRIVFGGNQISGNIPYEIGNLVNLRLLALEMNHLTGSIPSSIGRLKDTNILSLFENQLSGSIPSTLANITLLSTLYLFRNNLRGKIPKSLGDCVYLKELNLAENNLSGSIPSQIMQLKSLSILLDLSKNNLTGSIPIEVGELASLGRLDISENKLSGEIPNALGLCKSMEYLNLQENFLNGSIPEELKSLRGIQIIDLSRNNLSGKIPVYFADFGALTYLNLSFNDLEGEVLQHGIFKNLSRFSVAGNPRLCGGLAELKLGKCASNVLNKNPKLSTKTKSLIIAACASVTLVFILFIMTVYFRARKRNKPINDDLSVGISLPRVSYGNLSKATDGFSSTNLIGIGSFGSVYKGKLDGKDKLVAVKVLNLQVSHALKSFIAECESLRVFKHRNLVKLVTVCSSIDFRGNDFKALVYEFMENGNLEEWLYGRSDSLNLMHRVSIAVDVASALDYLHNQSSESIAHCDVKPSNVLLDEHMSGHVGDFGLAKLVRSALSPSSDQISSVGVRGTIGYIAPEYAMGSEASTIGDVYSFGILVLEMFTAKKPTDKIFKDDFNLNTFASAALPNRVGEIIDAMLFENVTHSCDKNNGPIHECLVSIFEIGVACSLSNPGGRMSIGYAAAELRRIRDVLNAH